MSILNYMCYVLKLHIPIHLYTKDTKSDCLRSRPETTSFDIPAVIVNIHKHRTYSTEKTKQLFFYYYFGLFLLFCCLGTLKVYSKRLQYSVLNSNNLRLLREVLEILDEAVRDNK